MQQSSYHQYRYLLKDSIRKTIDFSKTDQSLRIPPPPIEKPYKSNQDLIPLIPSGGFKGLYKIDLQHAIRNRQSHRDFTAKAISLTDLSFLLWATQGIRDRIDDGHALRIVPSAGARHALETYLAVLNVENLAKGYYRYLPIEHELVLESHDSSADQKITEACFYQNWIANAAVIFIWAAIPYRMEWRYGLAAHKVILIDVGHVCQNLYLACEAIGAGTCAVGAYDQEKMDQVLGLDGNDEFVIYMAPVGKTL
ncbi:MAG TPA: SagB/ThcOx family dehydrogenase [Dehalococcoidia bacterium]|nr:SagB/ThcOx family dehydrogenase [Dehalococcoidia bacterium]